MSFEFAIRVYWEDTDAGGIVFYANYLKFFERARTEWLRSLGLSQHVLRERTGGMFVVTDTTVRYLQPAVLDDLLVVTAQVVGPRRASLTLDQTARRQHDGLPIAQGRIRVSWVDAQTLRPARIPPVVLEAMEAAPS